MTIGISKRELLNEYYPDEINAIFDEYNRLHTTDSEAYEGYDYGADRQTDPLGFFGIKHDDINSDQ